MEEGRERERKKKSWEVKREGKKEEREKKREFESSK